MECCINYNYYYLIDHLAELEKKTLSTLLSFEARDKIHAELDLLLESALSMDAPFSSLMLEEIKDRIIYLYGKTDDLCLEQETKAIFQEALTIQDLFPKGATKALKKRLAGLKKSLSLLWKNFCPGLEERKKLTLAKQILQNGKRLLKGDQMNFSYENPFQQADREEALLECVNYLTKGS